MYTREPDYLREVEGDNKIYVFKGSLLSEYCIGKWLKQTQGDQ